MGKLAETLGEYSEDRSVTNAGKEHWSCRTRNAAHLPPARLHHAKAARLRRHRCPLQRPT